MFKTHVFAILLIKLNFYCIIVNYTPRVDYIIIKEIAFLLTILQKQLFLKINFVKIWLYQ